jgi:hypothetical protein
VFLEDAQFLSTYESFAGKSDYHSLDRKYALNQLLNLIEDLPGDTAECGVLSGISSFLICEHNAGRGKKHHVFDSFEGLSEPLEQDGQHWKKGDFRIGEEIVRNNLRNFDCVVYHKGFIPERFKDVRDGSFSFVHVDVDLFQPTKDSLSFFYDRMAPGGIILCDDYGFTTCPGATKAMDAFFSDKREKIIKLPTGQAFIIKK